jgi:hypothetical protein
MKSKTTRPVDTRPPHPDAVDPRGTTAPQQEPARHAQPRFDDLHARMTARAYELYVQGGYRDGAAMEHWLQAEREIVSREFPD